MVKYTYSNKRSICGNKFYPSIKLPIGNKHGKVRYVFSVEISRVNIQFKGIDDGHGHQKQQTNQKNGEHTDALSDAFAIR